MTAELSKAEKERLLDEKMKMMKARNALIEQRKREVDRDRKIAESSKSSITVAPKPKYENEPVTPPDRLARPSGSAGASGKPRRQSDESHFDQQRIGGPPQTAGATSSARPSRLQNMEPDPFGPPPDPGYRFLADRMREDDQASGTQGDEGSASSKKNIRDAPPYSTRAAANRSSRGGGKPSRDRGQQHNNKDHHPYRTPLMEEEDDVILVSESDRRGNTVTYHHHQHIDNTTPSKLMDDHNNTRRSAAGSAGKRADPRSTNNMLAASGSPNSKPQTPQSASKLKSLFDDDDEEYYFPERWKGKEHHPKLFDAARKIEQTAGGKLMVTRTIDPVARLESEFSVPVHSNKLEQQKELFSKRNDGKDNNTVILSEIEWQCSDPACRNLNPPRTANCARCRLAFSMSNEYKNSLACDKYKQEFRRHLPITSAGGLPSSMPQELLQQPTTGGNQQGLVDHPGANFVNGMVDTSQQQVPVTNFFSVSDHHQHPVHAAASWQGQQEYTTAGTDWTGQLQPQDSQEAAAVAAYQQQQQEILLSQNFGMIMNQHQMAAAQVAAAQAGFTSSNYFEPPQSHHQAVSQHTSRQMDPTANQYYPHQPEFVAHPAYLDQLHGTGGAPFSTPGFNAQQSAPTPNQFNPVAQAFVPTTTNNSIDQHATHTHGHKKTAAPAPTPLYQTPPPLLPASMLNRPPPPSNNKSDPNLLVSLNSPPKPLRINRLDPSKHIRSSRHSEGGMVSPSASSRLTDKNTHYHNQQKLPPRFSKPRELNHNFKPPSLVEMQSGTLKRGSNQLPPPPADKGTGLLVFGTSNVMNNLDAERFSKFIGINVRMVAAMRLELFQSAVAEIDPSRDWLVLIHGLGNDARNIALKLKSDQAKAKEADEVANTYCDLIERDLLGASPHIRVLISLLLPRFDFEEKSGLSNPNIVRKVINVAITERLYENPRVELINSDQCLCLDNEEQRSLVMGSDGYHLTHEGFKAMVGNWIKYLSAIIREAFPRQSRTSIPSNQTSTPPRAKAMAQKEKPNVDSSVDVNALTVDDSDIPNPLLTTETSESVEDVSGSTKDTKVDEEGKVGTGETVPDPFGTYTAPVNVMSPSSRKEDVIVPTAAFDTALPVSDDESDVDDGGIPSLETVEQPISSLMMLVSPDSSSCNHLDKGENLQLLSNGETFANPLMEPETTEKSSSVLQATEDKSSITPDKEETSTVTADKEEIPTMCSQKEETFTDTSGREETSTVNIDILASDNTINGLNNNLAVECLEKVKLEETELVTDAPKPIEKAEELVKEASKPEEETKEVVLKPIFKLGRSGGEVADMNGEEFIDDEYVVNGGGVITQDPLPSMIHCSGPESTDFEPASGIFLEDSYLPSNLESLNLADTMSKPCPEQSSQHINNKIENSEPEITRLTENGGENLIET